MTTDFRRHWQAALATLLIWCCAGLLGSIVQAADEKPAPLSDVESQALAERLDALIEQAAARVGKQGVQGGEPGTNVVALRQQLEAAETQIALLKNVVIQALRAQSAAEATLHRGQAAPQTAAPHEGAPETGGQGDLAVADQLAALTATVQSLQAEVHALRREVPPAQVAERDTESLARESSSEALAAPVEEEDAMLADSGMGGKYEPLLEDGPSGSDLSDPAATASGDAIQVAKVHFNSGSARLTPAGERKTLAAAERIRSMEPAKVRVVAFTDRVGDAAYNRVLSKERALSVAALLESVGLPRDMVEVVGSGEDGIPEPTPDGVPEPLNRCAGIFVVRDSTG